MDSKYGIFKYNIDVFSTYISYQTNTPLSYIRQKQQIVYFDNYINKVFKNKIIVFIYENEYIDKQYLKDYETYYASCFQNYKKVCSRVHFFELEKDTDDYLLEFKKLLDNKSSLIKKENYIGHIVIRPIPKTFFAKICIKSFINSTDRLGKFLLKKSCKVSLFGIELSTDSIAFQEQDRILSACATTSLWTFYHASQQWCGDLPSDSEITKSAYSDDNGYGREFPTNGLSTEMICRSLSKYNYASEYFDFSKQKNLNLLKEYIFTYCSSGYPLILGINVKRKKSNGKYKNLGLHAITIIGYSMTQDFQNSKSTAHNINALYVHDDRFGPYLKIDLTNDKFVVTLDENNTLSPINTDDEIYEPDVLILGLYHKIRVPYIKIKDSCIGLIELVSDYLKEKDANDPAKLLEQFQWDIQLKENNQIKSDIRNSTIIENKEYYLTKSLPKYLWYSIAYFEGTAVFGMLFDATDIEHGDIFLEFIPLSKYSKNIVEIFKVYSDEYFQNKISNNITYHNGYIWGIVKYFRENESHEENLCKLYGYLKIPNKIKEEELSDNKILNKREIRLNSENDYEKFKLDKSLENEVYIWVIDKDGFLCIGREFKKSNQGHPTLTDGMPARVGGELIYNYEDKEWIVNPFSGRYSSEYTLSDKVKYVENTIKYKFQVFFPDENFKIEENI